MTVLGETRGTALLNLWAEYMQAIGQSPATIRLHTQTVTSLARSAGVPPESVTRQDCIHFLARPLSAWSKLTYWKALKAWSRFLVEFGHRSDDLLKGVPRPRTPEPVARPLTDETVARLLSAPLSSRAAAYVRLALFAGLRVHEIARIRGEHLDRAAGWLLVAGKGGNQAYVPLHPEVEHLAAGMSTDGYWFPSPAHPGQPISPKTVTAVIGQALQSVGSTATAHCLRDTCATRIQRKVRDIRITQTLLRHRSIKSTQKYCGVADTDVQAAVLALDWAS
jgi:integrase